LPVDSVGAILNVWMPDVYPAPHRATNAGFSGVLTVMEY